MDDSFTVNLCQKIRAIVRDEQLDFPVLGADKIAQVLDQHIQPLSGVN